MSAELPRTDHRCEASKEAGGGLGPTTSPWYPLRPWGAVFAPLTVLLALERRRPEIDFARVYALADTQTIGFMGVLCLLS